MGNVVVLEADLSRWLAHSAAQGDGVAIAPGFALDGGEVVHVFISPDPPWKPSGRPIAVLLGLDRGAHMSPDSLLATWTAPLPVLPALEAVLAVTAGVVGRAPTARAWRRHEGRWVASREVVVPGLGNAFSRNAGLLESDSMANRKVGIIGLGSGGGTIAVELAKAGVGRFFLADRDRLELHNVGRHVCDLTDLGRRKTAAVSDKILARNPAAELQVFDGDVVEAEADGELDVLLADCDVLVGATDNNRSRRLVNRIALEHGKPAVFGRAYTRACGGDVIRVRPDLGGPCYECLIGSVDEEVSSASSEQAVAYADRPAVVEPGLALDIAPIALMCVRLVIQELVRGTGSTLESLDQDLPGSLFVWANRRDGQFAGWKPMGFGVGVQSVHRWYCARAPRNPLCAACNEEAFLRDLAPEAQPSG